MSAVEASCEVEMSAEIILCYAGLVPVGFLKVHIAVVIAEVVVSLGKTAGSGVGGQHVGGTAGPGQAAPEALGSLNYTKPPQRSELRNLDL